MSPTEPEADADADAGSEEPDFSFEVEESEVDVSLFNRLATFWREFIYRPGVVAWSDWRTRIGLFITSIYVLMATYGVMYYPAPISNQAEQNQQAFTAGEPVLQSPIVVSEGSVEIQSFVDPSTVPLGTTRSGVDVLAKTIHSTPDMLIMVAAGAGFATVVALVLGTTAGYKGGRVDRVLTTFSDVAMSIPGLPLVMVAVAIVQPQDAVLIGILITINYWAGLGRSIRSQVLSLRENAYVEASRTMGIGTGRILVKDVIPNLMPFVLVNFVNAARYVVFASVGLFYLGILPTSTDNWGIMLNNAYFNGGALTTPGREHWLIVPMVAIMGLTLGLVLLAQGMDRIFNPRVRTRLAGESGDDAEDDDSAPAGAGVMH